MSVDQKAARLVSDALDLFGKNGKNWTKGDMKRGPRIGETDFRYCAVGALREVAFGDVKDPISVGLDAHPNMPAYRRAIAMVGEALSGRTDVVSRAKGVTFGKALGTNSIIMWNDNTWTDFNKVRESFRTAILRLRGK